MPYGAPNSPGCARMRALLPWKIQSPSHGAMVHTDPLKARAVSEQ